MPSEDDSDRTTMMELCVSREWLMQELRSNPSRLIILDCRSSNEYGESHIRHAVNFSIPSIMLRRLAAGKIDLMSTIKCRELKTKIMNAYKENIFVVYGDFVVTDQQQQRSQAAGFTSSDTLHVLAKRLAQDGCQVFCLEGGFTSFRSGYPEWCESCTELMVSCAGSADVVAVPLMGLRSLRISSTAQHSKRQPHFLDSSCSSAATSSTDSSDSDDRCDSSLGLEDDRDFPVKILPHLFLGNQSTSADSEALNRHNIQYILNVTADLPNVFEGSGVIKYMQIPIADHWSQNLASFFPKAFEFIGAGDLPSANTLGETYVPKIGQANKEAVRHAVEDKQIVFVCDETTDKVGRYEARSNEKGVLVHCLAGVSRSVTITVAYLMYKLSLNLNDAFNLVGSLKSNIAPNFHFMQQLHSFEQELAIQSKLGDGGTRKVEAPASAEGKSQEKKQNPTQTSTESACSSCGPECKCGANFLSPLAIGTSPDSGIEFDRWTTSGSGE